MLPFIYFCVWAVLSAQPGGAQEVASGEDGCLAQTNLAVLRRHTTDPGAEGEPDEELEANPSHPDDYEPSEHGYAPKSENDTADDEPGVSLLSTDDPHNCNDNPSGWYDSESQHYHCGWYAQGDRCRIYGNGFPRLGKTANEACCACGGGGGGGGAAHGPWAIVSRHNGHCLDMDLGGSRNVYVHPCHGGENQLWYFEEGHLKNLHSGRYYCLDQDLGHSQRGNLYMGHCHDGWNQKFYHMGDAIFIANQNPYDHQKRALDVNLGYGSNVYIHPWHGNPNQQWDITVDVHPWH